MPWRRQGGGEESEVRGSLSSQANIPTLRCLFGARPIGAQRCCEVVLGLKQRAERRLAERRRSGRSLRPRQEKPPKRVSRHSNIPPDLTSQIPVTASVTIGMYKYIQ